MYVADIAGNGMVVIQRPVVVKETDVSRALNETAKFFSKPGTWGQGFTQNGLGQICTDEALRRTCIGLFGTSGFSEVYYSAVYAMTRVIKQPISTWNDTIGRTREEVVSALRLAAATAEQVTVRG